MSKNKIKERGSIQKGVSIFHSTYHPFTTHMYLLVKVVLIA
jgi:hypothetical protein